MKREKFINCKNVKNMATFMIRNNQQKNLKTESSYTFQPTNEQILESWMLEMQRNMNSLQKAKENNTEYRYKDENTSFFIDSDSSEEIFIYSFEDDYFEDPQTDQECIFIYRLEDDFGSEENKSPVTFEIDLQNYYRMRKNHNLGNGIYNIQILEDNDIDMRSEMEEWLNLSQEEINHNKESSSKNQNLNLSHYNHNNNPPPAILETIHDIKTIETNFSANTCANYNQEDQINNSESLNQISVHNKEDKKLNYQYPIYSFDIQGPPNFYSLKNFDNKSSDDLCEIIRISKGFVTKYAFMNLERIRTDTKSNIENKLEHSDNPSKYLNKSTETDSFEKIARKDNYTL